MSKSRLWKRAAVAAAFSVALSGGFAWSTTGNTTSTLIGRATINEPFKVKRSYQPTDWEVEVEAKPNLDVAVQTITFNPGAHSGWHSHPGPVFISVIEGTLTFYEADACVPIVRSAHEGFLDAGAQPHIARNETDAVARVVVTYFAPPGSALRIDQPQPASCPL